MCKKHPKVGKVRLANMYFLMAKGNPGLCNTTDDSGILERNVSEDGYIKFKNYK
jgi:hypothetical protein